MRPGVVYDSGLKKLLDLAAQAYRRRDDDAFRSFMEEAVDRAPHRLDLWLDLANHHIQVEAVDMALNIFRELARTVPRDVEVLTCLAHWERYLGEREAAADALVRLAAERRSRAEDVERIWAALDRWLAAPVTDALPELTGGALAIVVLGYLLHDNGAMDRILAERLEKALAAADRYPGAILVVTGGVPRNGRVEAVAMREWLVDMGVEGERIFEEGYARDVVENLLYSRQILGIVGVDGILCVTSARDVRRAGAGMEILGWAGGCACDGVAAVAASGESFNGWNDDGNDRLKLYRDSLRVYGLPMMRTYPELAER